MEDSKLGVQDVWFEGEGLYSYFLTLFMAFLRLPAASVGCGVLEHGAAESPGGVQTV